MLLRNKRTGFVYAFSKALENDPEFEVVELPVKEVPQKQETVVVRKRRVKPNVNTVQQGSE